MDARKGVGRYGLHANSAIWPSFARAVATDFLGSLEETTPETFLLIRMKPREPAGPFVGGESSRGPR